MKTLFYKLFALFYRFYCLFKIEESRITLLAPHPRSRHDSLSELKSFALSQGGYEIREISVPSRGITDYLRFFLFDSKTLAASKYIFLNDNFMPMAEMNIRRETVVTQLWHGEGAFKKFGLSTDIPRNIADRLKKCSQRLDYIVTTSDNINDNYSEAFGADKSKIISLGSPRCDYLIRNDESEQIRESFNSKFPAAKGKKLILYAPTFRDDEDRDRALLQNTDFEYIKKELGGEYEILIKLHPRIHTSSIPPGIINVTDFDINELTLISDMLITDYSSVCMNFALLSKPCIFYAYDLSDYKTERAFYFEYESYVPGKVIFDFRALPQTIKNPEMPDNYRTFRDFNFKYKDCRSSERIFNKIIKASS